MEKMFVRGVLLLSAAVAMGGCGGPVAPANPTWEKDVRPLLVARCIRCHDEGGHKDSLTSIAVQALPVSAFNFNYGVPLPNPAPTGIQVLHSKAGIAVLRGPIGSIPIMPPPPAEKLEDWQIETLENWAAQADIR